MRLGMQLNDTPLRRALTVAPARGMRSATDAIVTFAERVIEDSRRDYVPVESGELRDSLTVEPPSARGDVITVRFGVSGPARAYALVQHERLDYKHRIGGPKYLERPLMAIQHQLPGRIADAMRRGRGR